MKFRTADLIARIDSLIADRERANQDAAAKATALVATERDRWLDEQGPAFILFANRIKEKVRKGRPVTYADTPEAIRNRYGPELKFHVDPNPKARPVDTASLLTLKAALEAVEDEFVTTTGLREIGFRDLSRLFGRSA